MGVRVLEGVKVNECDAAADAAEAAAEAADAADADAAWRRALAAMADLVRKSIPNAPPPPEQS